MATNNPGEKPLPEDFCVLDHPYPDIKRWAAKVLRLAGMMRPGDNT